MVDYLEILRLKHLGYSQRQIIGTAIVPARVRMPKDKSHAEAAVRMAETWILTALRTQKFFSLSELREAVVEKLEELNTRSFANRSGNRKTAYLEEE